MSDYPLLVLPSPTKAGRASLNPARSKLHVPTSDRQSQRLSPKFEVLKKALDDEAIAMRTSAAGVEPEQVIVLEIVGTIEDFANAVRRVEGLEWLAEWDQDEIAPDEDFFRLGRDDEENHKSMLKGRLFLIMSNQRGMDELISLWKRHQANADEPFERGFNKFKHVFKHLKELRRWDERDRILETGVEQYWRNALKYGYDPIRFEVEFWYRADEQRRGSVYERFKDTVVGAGGSCLGQCAIPEIAYHAAVVQLPPNGVEAILESKDTRVIRSNDVMFFRPLGQCAVDPPDEIHVTPEAPTYESTGRLREPVAALLDGMPLENHSLLGGRLVLDDPDDWASSYPASDRQHGTGMASLILHGDLDAREQPLDRLLYVRPIMLPNPHGGRSPRGECIPEELLPAELVRRALRRMFEGDGDLNAVAPNVRIVNLSLGDPGQLFDYQVSAWARVLDWLAWKYKLLIIVSAGNHPREILLDPVEGGLSALDPGDLQRRVIQYVASEVRHRRLLSPAESVNALTVGALHTDSCPAAHTGNRVDLISPTLPSLGNALGHGFKRSVKPEILMPGGRQLYREQPDRRDGKVRLKPVVTTLPPGIRLAIPGASQADRSTTGYTCGSSNSAALTTRGAIQLHDRLLALKSEPNGDALRDDLIVVVLKALLVHGAAWGQCSSILEAALRNGSNDPTLKSRIARFLGYGTADLTRILDCTKQRATMIGCNSLAEEEAHEYFIPLPTSLSGRTDWRRLTVTLAWLTPISPQHHRYRQAHLWFDPPRMPLRVTRREADWQAVRRGTIQHEVLEGDDACVISEGDGLKLTVNCRSDAGRISDLVPYAIAVSLEVAENIDISIYQEIKDRLRPRIKPPGAI